MGEPEYPAQHDDVSPDQGDAPRIPEEPAEGEARVPHAQAQPVEALMGFRDFLAVAPRHGSTAVTVAAQSALQRWMRIQGHDVNGFYTMAQWQEYYAATMRHT